LKVEEQELPYGDKGPFGGSYSASVSGYYTLLSFKPAQDMNSSALCKTSGWLLCLAISLALTKPVTYYWTLV